ncbi:hypothetical protein KJ644_02610 [Candidatus Dependentiae bacterium]|nr:hypothetical protein [Candidatus Dependentiae bacterium]MBU4387340.1 hypothetical protein [Candidatus Dependentiae bacterium]MCG2756195.1 hypothetical protein [Candidatus Dependentiae bacterium]
MKHSFLKTTCALIVAAIIYQSPVTSAAFQNSRFNITDNAISTVNNKIKNHDDLYKASITYGIGNNEISIKTRIHHTGYRKKPDFYEEKLHTNTSLINAKEIVFVYNKKDPFHISQTIKGSKKNVKIALSDTYKKIFSI